MLRQFLQTIHSSLRKIKPTRSRRRKATLSYARRAFFQRLESLEPRLPFHANDVMHDEHEAMMALVQQSTHVAVASGDWDSAATWKDQKTPGAGARVQIPAGITVRLDSIENAPLKTVRVDGTLRFEPSVSTRLTLDTMVVTTSGTLSIGTASSPIVDSALAEIVIAADTPIDTAWDPLQLSRGIIAHGKLDIFGAETTPFVKLSSAAVRGAKTFVLAEMPVGWDPGEQLVLTGSKTSRTFEDERAEILSIATTNGTPTVTLSAPLKYSNPVQSGESLYVANLSRNVRIRSQSVADLEHRGHVMIMHNPNARIENAGFYGLGRTDKSVVLDNTIYDHGTLKKIGTNQTGRYAIHVHRTGLEVGAEAVVIRGSVVAGTAVVEGSAFSQENNLISVPNPNPNQAARSILVPSPKFLGSPGWGIVNHSSHVLVEGNTVYDVTGASFATEAGDEIGTFQGNLAVRTRGSGSGFLSRKLQQDFGHEGTGFWFQGPGVGVEGNISGNHPMFGYAFFTEGLIQPGLGKTRFRAEHLPDQSWANGEAFMDVDDVPLRRFADNVAFSSRTGVLVWTHLFSPRHSGRSLMERFHAWNVIDGIDLQYTGNLTLNDITLRGRRSSLSQGVSVNIGVFNIQQSNLRVEGFEVGVMLPRRGGNVLRGGYYNNGINFEIQPATQDNRTIEIVLSPEQIGPKTQVLVKFNPSFKFREPDITPWFSDDEIVVTMGSETKQLYFDLQRADVIPFPSSEPAMELFPTALRDKTNEQLLSQYGLAVGGAVVPANATQQVAGFTIAGGWAGDRSIQLPDIWIGAVRTFVSTSSIFLRYRVDGGKIVTETEPTKLVPGWNVVVRPIGGRNRGILIYYRV